MAENHSTIIYSIQDYGFKYHLEKAELKKGSLISKKVHPAIEVEDYKTKLIKKRVLKDYNQYYYILKKTIKIGGLMAYNLFAGENKEKFDINYPIVINSKYDSFGNEYYIKNIFSTDSILHTNVAISSYKLKKVSSLKMNFDFIREHEPNKFSPIERVIKDLLVRYSYIDKRARHGIDTLKECDIVDEKNSKQVEVIVEFKNRLKNDKMPQNNIDMLVIENTDNNLIQTSKALINKYEKKEYTEKYEKGLAIFCVGNRESVITMLNQLIKNLKSKTVKNNFTMLYILYYDMVRDEYYWYPSLERDIEKVAGISDKIIYKKEIDYNEMVDDEKYLIECKSIFNSGIMISYLTGKEIRDFAKKIDLIIE